MSKLKTEEREDLSKSKFALPEEAQAARRTLQQTDAELTFELRHAPAYGRDRHPKLPGGR